MLLRPREDMRRCAFYCQFLRTDTKNQISILSFLGLVLIRIISVPLPHVKRARNQSSRQISAINNGDQWLNITLSRLLLLLTTKGEETCAGMRQAVKKTGPVPWPWWPERRLEAAPPDPTPPNPPCLIHGVRPPMAVDVKNAVPRWRLLVKQCDWHDCMCVAMDHPSSSDPPTTIMSAVNLSTPSKSREWSCGSVEYLSVDGSVVCLCLFIQQNTPDVCLCSESTPVCLCPI